MLNGFVQQAAAVGILVGSILWTASALAGVTAHVVTEAEINSAGTIATAGDVKNCAGCQARISSTGTATTAAFGTSQSDSLARATADYGILKTFATATSNGQFGEAKVVMATASFSDAFTINATGLDGQHGTVVIPLEFAYTSSRSGQASGKVTLTLTRFVGGGTDIYKRSLSFNSDGTTTSDSFDPVHVVTPFSTSILATLDFVFGQPVSFEVALDARGGGFFDQSFTLDAEHSAFWGGFRSVTDASGDAVAYTLAPGSQADWSKSFIPLAVPEADTYALMLAGLGALAFFLRRRTPVASICSSRKWF
jgi:hypothetical protein